MEQSETMGERQLAGMFVPPEELPLPPRHTSCFCSASRRRISARTRNQAWPILSNGSTLHNPRTLPANVIARYYLVGCAVCFYCGRGVTEDEDKAITWLRAAARQGHLPSMFHLALQTDDEEAMLLERLNKGKQLYLGKQLFKENKQEETSGEAHLWLHRLETASTATVDINNGENDFSDDGIGEEGPCYSPVMQKGGRMLTKLMDRKQEGRRIPSSLAEPCSGRASARKAGGDRSSVCMPEGVWDRHHAADAPPLAASFLAKEKKEDFDVKFWEENKDWEPIGLLVTRGTIGLLMRKVLIVFFSSS